MANSRIMKLLLGTRPFGRLCKRQSFLKSETKTGNWDIFYINIYGFKNAVLRVNVVNICDVKIHSLLANSYYMKSGTFAKHFKYYITKETVMTA